MRWDGHVTRGNSKTLTQKFLKAACWCGVWGWSWIIKYYFDKFLLSKG